MEDISLNRISLPLLHTNVWLILNILEVRFTSKTAFYTTLYNTRLSMQRFDSQEFINTVRGPREKMDRFTSPWHHENWGLSQEAISQVYFASVSKRGLILNHSNGIAFDRHEYELVSTDPRFCLEFVNWDRRLSEILTTALGIHALLRKVHIARAMEEK